MTRYTASIEVLAFDSVRLAETGSTGFTVSIANHGLNDGDFFVNMSQSDKPPIRYQGNSYRRRVFNTTANTFNVTSAISAMTTGDICILYKFDDITDKLKDGSLRMSLLAQNDDSATFDVDTTYSAPGSVVVMYGYDDITYISDVYEYNISTKAWTAKTSGEEPRINLIAETLNDKVYVAMGENGTSPFDRVETAEYVLDTDTWTNKSDAPNGKYFPMSAEIDDIMYVGGGQYSAFSMTTTCEKYVGGTDTWSSIAELPSGRAAGDGVNVVNTLFCLYSRNNSGLDTEDIFYLPDADVWTVYPVDHSDPDRVESRSNFTIDGFKCNMVGGSSSYTGSINFIIANNTQANFPVKVYLEKTEYPSTILGGYATQYEHYGIIAGGIATTSSIYTLSCYKYTNSTDTWASIADLSDTVALGRGVEV